MSRIVGGFSTTNCTTKVLLQRMAEALEAKFQRQPARRRRGRLAERLRDRSRQGTSASTQSALGSTIWNSTSCA